MISNNYVNIASKKTSNFLCVSCESHNLIYENLNSAFSNLYILKIELDLNQIYMKDEKHGNIYPIIYQVLVCPVCHFSILSTDQSNLNLFNRKELKENMESRMQLSKELFPNLSFLHVWTLEHGLFAYILGLICYNFMNSPLKLAFRAICSIRSYWISKILFDLYQKGIFKNLSDFFLAKSIEVYSQAFLFFKNKNKFKILNNVFLGPNLHNWKVNGFFYTIAYLSLIEVIHTNLPPSKKIDMLKYALSILDSVLGKTGNSREEKSKSNYLLKKYVLILKDKINKNITSLIGQSNA